MRSVRLRILRILQICIAIMVRAEEAPITYTLEITDELNGDNSIQWSRSLNDDNFKTFVGSKDSKTSRWYLHPSAENLTFKTVFILNNNVTPENLGSINIYTNDGYDAGNGNVVRSSINDSGFYVIN